MNTDPWSINTEPSKSNLLPSHLLEFEDNFNPTGNPQIECTNILPDSKAYLESLEKKLKKLKSDSKILEQLAKKREECLNNLINNSLNLDSNVEFDIPVGGESAVYDIYRHLCPTQPITIGETIHILKYDQLQEEKSDTESNLESSGETNRMDSEFGRAFLFLTNLAWKCRITLPVLVTAVFMVMDIRLQIEINIQAGHLAADANGIEEESEASDDSWETLDSDDEDYEDDGDTDESAHNVDLKDTSGTISST